MKTKLLTLKDKFLLILTPLLAMVLIDQIIQINQLTNTNEIATPPINQIIQPKPNVFNTQIKIASLATKYHLIIFHSQYENGQLQTKIHGEFDSILHLIQAMENYNISFNSLQLEDKNSFLELTFTIIF